MGIIMFSFALTCLGEINNIRDQLCEEPELNTTKSGCRGLLKTYADCLDGPNPLSSDDLRGCFLDSSDARHLSAIVRSFAVARKYENSSVTYELARDLLIQERSIQSAGRRRRELQQRAGGGEAAHNWLTLGARRPAYAFRPTVLRNDSLSRRGYRCVAKTAAVTTGCASTPI